ncbi:hypothetical protein [Rhodanobacter sp. BL-MT-08]
MTRFHLPLLFPRRWRLHDIRRAPLTRWVLLVAAVMMLGLQSAMAAYACAMPPGGMATMAMNASTMDGSMKGSCPEMASSPTDHLLCAKHCASEVSAPTDVHPLSVPPMLLMGLPPALPTWVAHTQAGIAYDRRDRLRSPGPPANLLFCSLLI